MAVVAGRDISREVDVDVVVVVVVVVAVVVVAVVVVVAAVLFFIKKTWGHQFRSLLQHGG